MKGPDGGESFWTYPLAFAEFLRHDRGNRPDKRKSPDPFSEPPDRIYKNPK